MLFLESFIEDAEELSTEVGFNIGIERRIVPCNVPFSLSFVSRSGLRVGSFQNKALENEDRSAKHPISKTKHPISKTKHPNSKAKTPQTRKRRPLNLENEAPKTRKHCRFNKCNFTSYMTQSESGGGSGCFRTSKGPQNPSQGFITNCFTERF